MIPEFPNRLARIGAILTLIGSLVWIQWPVDFSKFNFAAVILLIGSFVTWVSVELADYIGTGNAADQAKSADNIKSDDVNKLNTILKIIHKKQFYILKQKAIQTYMEDDDYDGLRDLIYYRENDIFPFHTVKVQEMYEKFCVGCKDFYSKFYNLYTSDGGGRSTWRPVGNRYVSDEIYSGVMTEIAELDRKASSLAELWEQLIVVARQELKGASKSIERYDI
jgi:hypothetical protein